MYFEKIREPGDEATSGHGLKNKFQGFNIIYSHTTVALKSLCLAQNLLHCTCTVNTEQYNIIIAILPVSS